ncbi:MAG TPA: helix-turn-helix domain-containing protein [Verrucomicrobiae bacterium]
MTLPESPKNSCPKDNVLNKQESIGKENGSFLNSMRMAFSIKEVAEILGVSDKTVRRLINRKLLRPSRALRHLLIPKKEIERFLQET